MMTMITAITTKTGLDTLFKRSLFYVTKPAYASKVKLPKTIPATGELKEFKTIQKGYSFIEYKNEKPNLFLKEGNDINSNDSSNSRKGEKDKLPPLVKNYSVIGKREIELIKTLRQTNPSKWTINVLAKKYNVAASFIINYIFNNDEKKKLEAKVDNYIKKLSIKKQKGLVLRALIQRHRQEYHCHY